MIESYPYVLVDDRKRAVSSERRNLASSSRLSGRASNIGTKLPTVPVVIEYDTEMFSGLQSVCPAFRILDVYLGSRIPFPGSSFVSIPDPDPGGQKTQDLGSGSATLHVSVQIYTGTGTYCPRKGL